MIDSQTNNHKADILVVDDTVANLRLLVNILVEQGYKVRPASNGTMALSSARTEPPDLILLDIVMPNMDGYEVCAQLKADELTREIPVSFISAISEVLDWITQSLDESTTNSEEIEEIIVPPPDELVTLYKAAQIRDIVGVEVEANRLGQLAPNYVVFANRLLQLAQEFEEEEILKLVEQYILE
jgi:CheY-like chemotaxis protein